MRLLWILSIDADTDLDAAGICSIEKDKHEAKAFQQLSQITRLRAQEMFMFFRLLCDAKWQLLQQP